MQYYTHEEFNAWILSQPDDAPIKMDQSNSEGDCGCLLVQFARHKGLTGPFSCGYDTINADAKESIYPLMAIDSMEVSALVMRSLQDPEGGFRASMEHPHDYIVKTFGDAKKLLS